MDKGDNHLGGLEGPSVEWSSLLTAQWYQKGKPTFEHSGKSSRGFRRQVVSLQLPSTFAREMRAR